MANVGILFCHLMLVCFACVVAKRTIRCGANEKLENGKCFLCPTCPAGEGLVQDCGFGHGSGLQCTPCETGVTYRSDLTYRKCKLCTNCTFYNRKFLFLCRRVIDSECGECLPGYFVKQNKASHPPSICNHCSEKPSAEQCQDYRASTPITSITTDPEVQSVNSVDDDDDDADVLPYKTATYALLIALVLSIIVIVYLVCVLKKCVAFKYCERRNCCHGGGWQRRRISHQTGKNIERSNLLKDNDSNQFPRNCHEMGTSIEPDDMKLNHIQEIDVEHPLSPKTVVEEHHVKCAPKVGRSISDPGPNSSVNYLNSEDFRDNTNEGGTLVIQIPPAVVHVSCETNVPNMTVPFGSCNDVNNNQNDVVNGDVSLEGMSSLSLGSTLPIGNEVNNNTTLTDDASFFSQGSTLPIRSIVEDNSEIAHPDNMEGQSVDEQSDAASEHLSEASTLLIRNAEPLFENYPELPDRNSDRSDPHNSQLNMPIGGSNAFNIPMGNVDEESLYSCDHSEDNNNAQAHQGYVDNDHAEPMWAKPKLLQNPTTIQITINNNITGIGPVNPNSKEDKGINAVNGDDSDNTDDDIDLYHSESDDNSQTLPKCLDTILDITANRSSSSCAAAHASSSGSMLTQFHLPIQETLKSN